MFFEIVALIGQNSSTLPAVEVHGFESKYWGWGMLKFLLNWLRMLHHPLNRCRHSLLAEVSYSAAKMRGGRETSAGSWHVSHHACTGVSLTTSDVFLSCDTTHRISLHAKPQLKHGCVLENSSQSETMLRTPRSHKFGESASPWMPIGSGKDGKCLKCGLDFKISGQNTWRSLKNKELRESLLAVK